MGLSVATAEAGTGTNPGIRIDGQLRVFNPPSQTVNGRTMVPLRFVIEDPALNGSVNWDGNSGKVTVSCRDKNFEFIIGSPKVLVQTP
jgi:spore germination protein